GDATLVPWLDDCGPAPADPERRGTQMKLFDGTRLAAALHGGLWCLSELPATRGSSRPPVGCRWSAAPRDPVGEERVVRGAGPPPAMCPASMLPPARAAGGPTSS